MRGRLALKRRLGQLYAFLNVRDAHRKLILLYHSIGGGAEATTTEVFRNHLEIIASIGRPFAPCALVESSCDEGIAVGITFDDGYATLRDHAAPILMEFGCVPAVFVNVNELADDERRPSSPEHGYYPGEQFMTWRDVDFLLSSGWQIGSHGVHHLDLVSVDRSTSRNELSASKRYIEQRLGITCNMFAYPWGRNNAALRAEVRATGYRYAFSGQHSALNTQSDPFALPRINVAKEYERDDLAAILRGDWDYLDWLSKAKALIG